MANYFEDDVRIVISPRMATGPQGANAPEVKIQYSVDGETDWHDEYVDGDKYIRFSTDDGETWGNGIYFNNLSETIEWVNKAKAWAENPENVEVEAGKYSALHHAAKAAASASNAATSEANAATSEANAATSEANAATSAANAAQSETNAANSASEAATSAANAATSEANAAQSAANAAQSENNAATSASNAATSEANAAQSEANAAQSEANAAQSETNAAQSEANAATSATNAAQSETNAAASEEKAHKWAQEAEGVEVETGEYSAYHWAMKAKDTIRSPFAYPFIECGLAGIEIDIIVTGGTASSVGAYSLSGGNANEPV